MTSIKNYKETNKFGFRVGSVVKTNSSGFVEILLMNGYKEVTVKFLDSGNERVCNAACLNRGEVKDLIYGRGYTKRGFSTKQGEKVSKVYDCWRRMLHRTHQSWWNVHPTYTGATLAEEWFCYDTFYEWYENNCPDESWDLDKDLLSYDKLIYSPNTCCFLPEQINKALVYTPEPTFAEKKGRGTFELYFRGKYVTSSRDREELKPLYVKRKNDYVRSLAETHLDLSDKAREALKNYTLVLEDGTVRRVL